MPRTYLLYILLALSLALAVGHHYAFQNFWYWRFWWFDMLMHFGGGLFVGVAVLMSGRTKARQIIGLALLVGVAWEVFEWFAGVPYSSNFIIDTMRDLLCDIVGGTFVWGIMSTWPQLLLPLPAVPDVLLDQTS